MAIVIIIVSFPNSCIVRMILLQYCLFVPRAYIQIEISQGEHGYTPTVLTLKNMLQIKYMETEKIALFNVICRFLMFTTKPSAEILEHLDWKHQFACICIRHL